LKLDNGDLALAMVMGTYTRPENVTNTAANVSESNGNSPQGQGSGSNQQVLLTPARSQPNLLATTEQKKLAKLVHELRVILRDMVHENVRHIVAVPGSSSFKILTDLRRECRSKSAGDIDNLENDCKQFKQRNPVTKITSQLEDYLRKKLDYLKQYDSARETQNMGKIAGNEKIKWINKGLDHKIWYKFQMEWKSVPADKTFDDYIHTLRDHNRARQGNGRDYVVYDKDAADCGHPNNHHKGTYQGNNYRDDDEDSEREQRGKGKGYLGRKPQNNNKNKKQLARQPRPQKPPLHAVTVQSWETLE
jgi:hypothetical protein